MTDRPKLSPEVGARRHVVGARRLVVLHDQRAGRSVQLGEREWALVSGMDGTRDVGGLVRAAALRGVSITEEAAAGFVGELRAAGLLSREEPVPAAATAPPGADEVSAATPAERPLEPLPGFRLSCDGAGSCCRLYPTVAFLPRDVACARAARPDVLRGGDDEAALFTPVRGAVDLVKAVAQIDGRCALLEEDGRCGVHAALGPERKPMGCRTFPTAFADDGVSVRVTPRPECLCVPRSGLAEGGEGERLAPDGAARRDVPEGAHVRRLPPMVALGGGREVPREALSPWSRALAARAGETPDAARALVALARSLADRGLSVEHQLELLADPPPLWDAALGPIVSRIGAAAGARGRETWRAPRDLAHQAFVALETACDLVGAAPEAFTAGPRSAREAKIEAFHLRAALHGHLAVSEDGDPDLATALLERAAVVLVGRALGVVAELSELADPAFAWPLSLTEATVRGFALAARGT